MIADVQYGVLNAADAFQTGGIADAFWLGFYVLFALAALHPSMAGEIRSGTNQMERISNVRLVLMFVRPFSRRSSTSSRVPAKTVT